MAKADTKGKNKTTSANKEIKGKKAREEIKVPKLKLTEQTTQWDICHTIALWGLAALLFLSPYFRGLFFAPEQERALIFASLVFWLTFFWCWVRNDSRFLRTPLDWFALALPLVYIISSFTAVNKGLAIDEVIKNILYFMTYWSVSRLVRHDGDIQKLLHVIYLSAFGVALAGLATATGIININDGFLDGRIYSSFQYPNALAAYLGAVTFFGLYLWDRMRVKLIGTEGFAQNSIMGKLHYRNYFGYSYAIINYIILTVFFGANSRGGLLVFVLVLIIYLIGLGAEKRFFTTLHIGFLGIISFFAVNKFIPLAIDLQGGKAWLWILFGLVAVLASQFAVSYLNQYLLARWKDNEKNYSKTFGGLALFALIICGVWLLGHASILQKVTDFSYLRTAFQRVNYFGAAFEMFKERPITGWGGGGWQEAYRSFMDYYYVSRQVHSYYFQVGVETGILGIAAVAGIWISFLYKAHCLYHGSKGDTLLKQLVLTLTAVFLMIAGHAVIDFDLSLSALTLVLWSCFGIVAGISIGKPLSETGAARSKSSPLNFLPLGVSTTATAVIIIVCCIFLQAQSHMTQGLKMLQSQRVNEGVALIEKAVKFNPYRAEFRLNMAQVYSSLGSKDKAFEEAQKAVGLSMFDTAPRHVLAQVAMASGDYEQASAVVEEALVLNPNDVAEYEKAAGIYSQLGTLELASGQKDRAREYFQKSFQIPVRMDNYYQSVSEDSRKLWTGPKLSRTVKIKLYTGQTSYWLGDYKTAEQNLNGALTDEELKIQALIYLALLNEKLGDQQKSQEYLTELKIVSPDSVRIYENLAKLPSLGP